MSVKFEFKKYIMEILKTVCWIIQLLSAVSVVILVLLQHGKGADAGATFGSSGGSGSLFGASGASSFLSRSTAILATVFFIATFALVLLISNNNKNNLGVMSGFTAQSSKVEANVPTGGKVAAISNSNNAAKTSSSAISTKKDAKEQSGKNQIPQ